MTEIKLSPAMVAALKGAKIIGNGRGTIIVGLPVDTKTQTVKGLESRGLTDGLELTPEGVEAARQLGNDTTNLTDDVQIEQQATEIDTLNAILRDDTPKGEGITPEMVEQAARNLLKTPEQRKAAMLTETQQGALDDLAELLDTPVVVPNRADKRRAKFSLKGAISRMNERKRARRAAKYGDTKFGQVA